MKRVPIIVDTELLVQSVQHKLTRAKSKILGARHGDFIIIEHPLLQFSDRLSGEIRGEILCRFSLDGDDYTFASRVREHLKAGFSLIDYPSTFEQVSLRAALRVRVNLETRLEIEKQRDSMTVGMVDISAGGCKLEVPQLFAVAPGTRCTVTFSLPDGKSIEALKGTIQNVKVLRLPKTTELGVRFLEPSSELEKVRSFCDFCQFFQV